MKRVIVIGAGIIGASIAYHLASAGAAVTVFDTETKPGGLATPNSWAWINASWGNDREYVALRMKSMTAWRGLDAKVPGLVVNWCGSILWDLPPKELLAFAEEHKKWGYPTQVIGKAEIAKREPSLRNAPETAVHVAIEGAVEPLHAAEKFLAAAREAGATLVNSAHVKYLNEENGQITGLTTSEGTLEADEVVVASGIGSVELLKSVGLNLNLLKPAGLLVHSKPLQEFLNGIILSPKLHVRQTAEGRLVAGSDFGGTDPAEDPATDAENLFEELKEVLVPTGSLKMEKYTIGIRPTLPDAIPAIGRPGNRAGLYLAVMHSGITLAPVVGEIVTTELLQNQRDPVLSRYHPDRVIT